MVRFNDILESVEEYNPSANISLLKKAYVFSAKVHQGQNRLSGEPYLNHPLEAAKILTELKMDVPTIATGLLHDTVEDTRATLEEIDSIFGPEVTFLVDGVTKISKMTFSNQQERQAESFRKMLISMAKDIRVVIIKLADRLHNMRTLQYHSAKKSRSISRETLDIYVPLANRLGIAWIKSELEDISLRYLQPEIYKDLSIKIAQKKTERDHYILEVREIIEEKLKKYGVNGKVTGRSKHFFSIYEKMQSQKIEFEQINDLTAFRIIADSQRGCYAALGIIHSIWKPVPGRFKDYIAMPKGNMYQSLHTTIIGPEGLRLEVQIRTEEMHLVAEEGIAAHWKYKEGDAISDKDDRRFTWLRQMLEWQQEMNDPKVFMENFRVELFSDEVYVFTPKGEVMELPREASPIDFAFRVHSDVGMNCAGARVNGAIVNLRYQLKNGDTVEIKTSKKARPSKDWLRFVKTTKARTAIIHWVKNEEKQRSIDVGREILTKEAKKRGKSLTKILKSVELSDTINSFNASNQDDILSYIGYGKITPQKFFNKIYPEEEAEKNKSKRRILSFDSIISKISKRQKEAVEIQGIDDLMVRYARCCNPIVGDKIVGFITRGRGVTVHRSDCANALESNPERILDIQWGKDAMLTRPVKVKVSCNNMKGLLANMSSKISGEKANISSVHINTNTAKADCFFELEVMSLNHLEKVINALQKVKGIYKVERVVA